MEFTDTHCHVHFSDYALDPDEVIKEAKQDGVTRMICVGCTLEDSESGVQFALTREGVWSSIGLHPHEAHHYQPYLATMTTPPGVESSSTPSPYRKYGSVRASGSPTAASEPGTAENLLDQFVSLLNHDKVVAIGECGLDYYYNHSPKEAQVQILEFQLQLAIEHKLPVIFHVRDAFDDFWPIFDNFKGLQGIVHSFTADRRVLKEVLSRNLYIGLNGIMTFTKDEEQLEMAKAVPLDRLCLETDAPFLTPKPFRGKVCKPSHTVITGEFLADLRNISTEKLAHQTTENAVKLFNLKQPHDQ